jgi:hypothetical protein
MHTTSRRVGRQRASSSQPLDCAAAPAWRRVSRGEVVGTIGDSGQAGWACAQITCVTAYLACCAMQLPVTSPVNHHTHGAHAHVHPAEFYQRQTKLCWAAALARQQEVECVHASKDWDDGCAKWCRCGGRGWRHGKNTMPHGANKLERQDSQCTCSVPLPKLCRRETTSKCTVRPTNSWPWFSGHNKSLRGAPGPCPTREQEFTQHTASSGHSRAWHQNWLQGQPG